LEAYIRQIVKRYINLDTQLVRQAAEVPDTARTTDTVHAAMREVVAREHRRRLVESDLFADMSQEDLDAMRAPSTFGE
jgi:Arc/MetJ family transcription regulator